MNSIRYKLPNEWLKQSEYDLGTAQAMFKTKRYIYTVFMCHLCIEKALKGIYAKTNEKDPPRTHDLTYLCEKMNLELPENLNSFIDALNDLSVPTRYPDQLMRLLKDYKMIKTKQVLINTGELFIWLKKKL